MKFVLLCLTCFALVFGLQYWVFSSNPESALPNLPIWISAFGSASGWAVGTGLGIAAGMWLSKYF